MTNRYTCGAVVHWIADPGARGASGGRRDGFDLWAGLVREGDYSLADFRAAASRHSGAGPLLDALIDSGGVERWRTLAAFATSSGAVVEARPARAAMVRFPAARAIVLSACGAFWGAGDPDVDFYVSAPAIAGD